jgi:ligand-binding SRPBCC domain-containing protein
MIVSTSAGPGDAREIACIPLGVLSTRLHRLQTLQRVAGRIADVWAFLADPRNLGRITPPWMRFEILSPLPAGIYPGLMVAYRVRPVAGFATTWVTEITHVREPWLFVDEQRFGPYRFWHHQHVLRETPEGVEMEDIIHYALPLGPLASPINRLVVAPRLKEIFEFRRRALERLFAAESSGHPAVYAQ